MTKIKFKKYSRYDELCAQNGVDHTVVDELDQKRGTFKVSLFDTTSKQVQVNMERYQRENADAIARLTTAEERGTLLFVSCFLHGWSDVLDGDDKEVAFDKEAAFELLLEDQWLTEKLIAFSKNVMNFQGDPRAKKAAVAKN